MRKNSQSRYSKYHLILGWNVLTRLKIAAFKGEKITLGELNLHLDSSSRLFSLQTLKGGNRSKGQKYKADTFYFLSFL